MSINSYDRSKEKEHSFEVLKKFTQRRKMYEISVKYFFGKIVT